MNINLEESTTNRVSPLLEVIANKILSDLISVDGVQKDLFFVLATILLIENGFLPIDDDCELIDPIQSIDKTQMSKWKLSTGLYEALFMLGGCKSPTVKMVMSPLGATAIFNAVIRDLDFETYSVCLPVSRYVVPQAASIPIIFRDLKHFAVTFKNNILCAVKSRILSHCGYPSASLIGLPDEILLKIMLYLPVGDVINLCKTCNRLKYLLENDCFWHNMSKRDFVDVGQTEFKEWKQIYAENFLKQMDKKKRPHGSICFGTIHDFMDYSDLVSYIDNPMWNQLM